MLAINEKKAILFMLVDVLRRARGVLERAIYRFLRKRAFLTRFWRLLLVPGGHPNSPTCGHFKIPHPGA